MSADDPLKIPDFLRRPPPTDSKEPTMKPSDTQAAKSDIADAGVTSHEQKTPRKTVELPTQLSDGTVLADQTIEQLIAIRDEHQHLLANVPKIELELRAIRHQIRRKA